MQFELPPLPYKTSALKPYIGAKTVEIHYQKHHRNYLRRLNSFEEIQDLPSGVPLEAIILDGAKNLKEQRDILPPEFKENPIFEQAAQVYNHSFYWKSLKPKSKGGGGDPEGEIADLIEDSFQTLEKYKLRVKDAGNRLFGSGWIWTCLNINTDRIEIIRGKDNYPPFIYTEYVPLLVIDVWEHAYYLDYQNRREEYMDAVLDHLMNWQFANQNLENVE